MNINVPDKRSAREGRPVHARDVDAWDYYAPSVDDDQSATGRQWRDILLALTTRRSLAIVIVASFAISFFAWFYLVETPVEFFEVSRQPITAEIAGPGILDAINKVTITSRLAGFAKELSVDRNDSVTRDEVIAQLDARDVQGQLAGARSDLEAARNLVREAQSNHSKNQLLLQRATNELARKQTLIKTGVATAVELENAEISLAQAQADFERTLAAQDRAIAQVQSAEYQVQVLEVKRGEAEIRSPIDGIVVSRDRNVGDLVTVGAPLLQIVDPKSIIVSTRLDESILGAIQKGLQVSIQFTSDSTRKIGGRVLRVNRTVDAETREFMVDVVPDELPKNWAIGQRANVVIAVPLPQDSIAIPLEFVARRNGRAGVWRNLNNHAVWTEINVGTVNGIYINVVGGLEPGAIILRPKGRYAYEAVTLASPKT